MKFRRLLSLLTAAVVLPNLYIPVSVSDTVYAESREKTLVVGDGKYNYREEPQDGYLYEVWINDEGGSGKVTIGEGGTFNAEWDVEVPQGNFIVQRGLPYDYLKRTLNYRSIEIDYDADYSAGERGNSQLSIDGCIGIKKYEPDEIVIRAKDYMITASGSSLSMLTFSQGRVSVRGLIFSYAIRAVGKYE